MFLQQRMIFIRYLPLKTQILCFYYMTTYIKFIKIVGEQFILIFHFNRSINILPAENDLIRFLILFCKRTFIYILFFMWSLKSYNFLFKKI